MGPDPIEIEILDLGSATAAARRLAAGTPSPVSARLILSAGQEPVQVRLTFEQSELPLPATPSPTETLAVEADWQLAGVLDSPSEFDVVVRAEFAADGDSAARFIFHFRIGDRHAIALLGGIIALKSVALVSSTGVETVAVFDDTDVLEELVREWMHRVGTQG